MIGECQDRSLVQRSGVAELGRELPVRSGAGFTRERTFVDREIRTATVDPKWAIALSLLDAKSCRAVFPRASAGVGGWSRSGMQRVDLPIARSELRRSRIGFEHEPASLGSRDCDRNGVVGQSVAAPLAEPQPHRVVVPFEPKIETGELAFAMTQRDPI